MCERELSPAHIGDEQLSSTPEQEKLASSLANESSVEQRYTADDERAFYQKFMRQIIEAAPQNSDKREHLANIWEHAKGVFQGAEQEFDNFLNQVRTHDVATDAELAVYAASKLQKLRSQHFSVEEFETRVRAHASESDGFTPLTKNNLLYYNINEEGTELKLHVGIAHTMKVSEILRSFREGMEELLRQLKDKENLKGIKTISATSWIVAEHPKLLEKFGFTIEDAPIKRTATKLYHASIGREELLKRNEEEQQ